MAVTAIEKNILRELAKQYSEIAHDDVQKERVRRMRDSNDCQASFAV